MVGLGQALISYEPRIRMSVRHVALHAGSDQVVKLLEAARQQGKYWPTLERLLATQNVWVVNHTVHPDRVWPVLEGLGLDLAQLRVDMSSAGVAERVALDAADAKALNVTKTPEFFVNGRPLPSFGYDQLRMLVEEELAASRNAKAG